MSFTNYEFSSQTVNVDKNKLTVRFQRYFKNFKNNNINIIKIYLI